MTAYKTPGVYVEEIATLPGSVARVATAIPAFVGYTERSERGGTPLTNVAHRIGSRVEFEALFGGAPRVSSVTVEVSASGSVGPVTLDRPFYLYDAIRLFYANGGGPCHVVSVGCYEDFDEASVVRRLEEGLDAVARHDEPTLLVVPDAMLASEKGAGSIYKRALAQCRDLQDRFTVCDVRESPGDGVGSLAVDAQVRADVDAFRTEIGINDLRYGAAYTPWLRVSHPAMVRYDAIQLRSREVGADGEGAVVDWRQLLSGRERDVVGGILDRLERARRDLERVEGERERRCNENPAGARAELDGVVAAAIRAADALASSQDDSAREKAGQELKALVTFAVKLAQLLGEVAERWSVAEPLERAARDLIAGGAGAAYRAVQALVDATRGSTGSGPAGGDPDGSADAAPTGQDLFPIPGSQNALSTLRKFESFDLPEGDAKPEPIDPPFDADDGVATRLRAVALALKGSTAMIAEAVDGLLDSARELVSGHENVLYRTWPVYAHVVERVRDAMARVPPSGAVAGAMVTVDRMRGVWKAPANVSLAGVHGVTRIIDDRCQESLNVDQSAGKSINAIRAFAGKGVLVWGARTLAGNDSEWCFVSVRRLFNMIEESVRKALGPIVFEPNDANTWLRVRSMIENFLDGLWRAGALAGAKPDEAYFVNVGLGRTMTAADVLEGRMIVEIGLAAVRPAEFIIVKFSHKMQTA